MRLTRPSRPSAPVRVLAAAAVGLVLAACTSAPPAPIVARTGPAATPPAPSAPAPLASPGAPAAVPADPAAPAADAPVVQTAPVRSGTIESRGGSGTPPPPGGTVAAPPPTAVPVVPQLPPNARTTPRGVKLPYSDVAMAELRSAEPPSAVATDPKAAPPVADPKAPPPAADAADAAAEGDWAWPASGRMIQTFSQSANKGIVLAGKPGDPIVAAADGRVIFSGNGPRGYGNLVIVKHANELLSVYAHNRSLAVKEGQNVKRGQKIAELGDSGTNSPRLHFEIRQQGKPVDPVRFLPKR